MWVLECSKAPVLQHISRFNLLLGIEFPLTQDTLSWKTSLLVGSEMLRLFGNTLTPEHMYSRHYLTEISATCSNPIISKAENLLSLFY